MSDKSLEYQPTKEDIGHYIQHIIDEAWFDNVARFDHSQLRPMPTVEQMKAHRRVKAWLSRERVDV